MSSWTSKSAENSGSGNFNPPTPQADSSRLDPSGRTTFIGPNVRNGDQGCFDPRSASPANERTNSVDVPFGGTFKVPSMPWPVNSADRNGSNTNNSSD